MCLHKDELLKVCGGDYGYADDDSDAKKSMYNVGDSVEIYDNFTHITITTYKIVNKTREYKKLYYAYVDNDGSKIQWTNADWIQK